RPKTHTHGTCKEQDDIPWYFFKIIDIQDACDKKKNR
ncbi:unnamed protein product, partial [marine sediment metagenome]